jgi:hypothetical protein
MVVNLEILQEFIDRNSTQQEDHKIWNGVVRHAVTIVSIKKICGLSKKKYCPSELVWILTNNKDIELNTRLEKSCEISNCISHYNAIQYNLKSIVEMDHCTYVKYCERFEIYCEPKDFETKCINWNGHIDKLGYGQFGFLGKKHFAHRVAYMLENCEDIPEGQVIRHLCPKKNRRCVNPDHLTIGTHKENAQDELTFGYTRQGEEHPKAIISNEVAQMIIDSFGNKKSVKERAIEFNVSREIIISIDAARNWRSFMIPEQILEREGIERVKKNNEVLSDDIISKIKNSNETQTKCAKIYNITKGIVQRIKNGEYKSSLERDEIGFQEAIARLTQKSTKFKDPVTGVEHVLFKNDKSQDPNVKCYQISYLGTNMRVHRASYMAHRKIKSIEDGKMVRHKCLYKHCISKQCLELGTAQDNANDKKRDNTNKKGEQNHSAKITQQIATQIKQTKGIGTTQQRSEFFNVKIGIINSIDNHRAWTHIEDDKIDQEVIRKLEEYVTNQPLKKRVRLI